MKWYKRDPAAALEGMIGLSAEERGYYNTLLDLLYARAPDGTVTDDLVCKAMACNPRSWRAVKKRLIEAGKIWVMDDGTLMAKRVENTLNEARLKLDWSSNGVRTELEKRVGSNENNDLQAYRAGARAQTTTRTILESSLGKGSEAPQERVVPAAPVNYRDPGNDYRSPPARKPDLPPPTEEQRLAAMLLAAKTDQSTPRKGKPHERQTDDAESHADAVATAEAARTAAE